MSQDPNHDSPVNPIPPVVVVLFLVILGVEAAFSLGARGLIGGPEALGWRNASIERYGFNRDILNWMWANGVYPQEHLSRFLSFSFVHYSFTQALFAGAMVLALGKFVGDVFTQWATLVLFVVSSAAGALTYGLVSGGSPWLIGAFPGVYGLIGGFTYLMWLKLEQMGAQKFRAFTLIGFLLGIQLIFGLLFGSNGDWLADIGGFVAGFLASFVLSPGGFAKLRAKMRHE